MTDRRRPSWVLPSQRRPVRRAPTQPGSQSDAAPEMRNFFIWLRARYFGVAANRTPGFDFQERTEEAP